MGDASIPRRDVWPAGVLLLRVAVILTARPSWAKLEPVCRALAQRPDVELQIVACASALLERYGRVVDVVRQNYDVAAEVWSTYEGANLITSAKETGALLSELAGVLRRLSPDAAVACADRHEVLGAAQAVSYLHCPLVHLQGGERTGSIDDKVRDSITQLADVHCVATERAKYRVYGLTGHWDGIVNTGCPSIDLAKAARDDALVTFEELGGSGPRLDLAYPFLVVLQHPVTSEADQSGDQMQATLEAVGAVNAPRIVFWPGEDAGQEAMAKAIRVWKDDRPDLAIHTVRSLPPARFLKLLTQASVLVGNSSAGIREASYLGVPVVNIGSRQYGRERAGNVRDVGYESEAIWAATCDQVAHGPYPSSTLYGSGNAGEKIAEVIIGIESRQRTTCAGVSVRQV